MDIKEQIEGAVSKITGDKDLQEKFKKDPEKTVESVLGVNIPDGAVDKVVAGVKAKMGAGKIGGILGKLGL